AALRDVAAEAGGQDVEVLEARIDDRLVEPEKLARTCAAQDLALHERDVRSDTRDADAVDRCTDRRDRPRAVAVEVLDRRLGRNERHAVRRVEIRSNVGMRLIRTSVDDEDANVR